MLYLSSTGSAIKSTSALKVEAAAAVLPIAWKQHTLIQICFLLCMHMMQHTGPYLLPFQIPVGHHNRLQNSDLLTPPHAGGDIYG